MAVMTVFLIINFRQVAYILCKYFMKIWKYLSGQASYLFVHCLDISFNFLVTPSLWCLAVNGLWKKINADSFYTRHFFDWIAIMGWSVSRYVLLLVTFSLKH